MIDVHRFLALLLLGSLLSCSSAGVPSDLRTADLANKRRKAAVAIGHNQRTDMIPALLKAIRSDQAALVRAQCAIALAQLGTRRKQIYKTLVTVLKNDPNPLVQQDVIYALHELDYSEAAPTIAEKLTSSPNPDVRHEAAKALRNLGNEDVYPALVKGLKDDTYRVRHASHRALRSLTGLKGPMKHSWWKRNLSQG